MEGKPAIYLDRIVEKENFRTFVYSPNGSQRIVESWDEFESSMQSGLWFATANDAKANNANDFDEKPKVKTRSKVIKKDEEPALEPKENAPIDEIQRLIKDNTAFEVKDDFLPKG